ncbi:MAG: hypothetical protein ACRDBP_06490, partial [Luteolibacter sp.]
PVEDFAPQASSPAEASEGEDASPPPEGPAAGPIPQTDEAASQIPAPDGIVPLVVSPLATPLDPLAPGVATPFTAPTTEPALVAEEGALEEPESETPPPADARSAPWVAAPGGFSAPGVGGNAGGLGFAPSGFTSVNPGFPMGGVAVGEGVFDGFSISATLSGTYTSNATSSPGEPFAPIQDDFILGLGGSISYLSKASDWTFGGSYNGTYNQYLELTEYSGYDQNLSLIGNYDGTKLSATATGSVAYTQGNNRYYSSEFVQQTSYNFGLNLRYRLSTKTSLQGNIGQSLTTTSENSFNDTESFNMGLAALWKYSKLTEFGPGVRYSFLSGGNRDSRSSIGPELLVNYQLATKVSLNSRVGIEFSEYENGGSADPALTGSVGLVYNASRLWSMNLTLYKGSQADASSADVFTDVTSVRLGLNRKIRRATLNLGLSYEINSFQTSGTSTASGFEDRNYFNINTSVGMPVFANSCFASVFVQYNNQTGSVTDTFDAVQSGFSISRRF